MICRGCATPQIGVYTTCLQCGSPLPIEKEEPSTTIGILVLEEHPDVRFFIRQRAVLGRTSRGSGPVDIDLREINGSEFVSRRHAEIYWENHTFWIRDLNSTNGTFVNEEGPIHHPHRLYHGARIRLGSVKFQFFQEGGNA